MWVAVSKGASNSKGPGTHQEYISRMSLNYAEPNTYRNYHTKRLFKSFYTDDINLHTFNEQECWHLVQHNGQCQTFNLKVTISTILKVNIIIARLSIGNQHNILKCIFAFPCFPFCQTVFQHVKWYVHREVTCDLWSKPFCILLENPPYTVENNMDTHLHSQFRSSTCMRMPISYSTKLFRHVAPYITINIA